MTKTTYTCEGCRFELSGKDDIRRQQGTVRSSYFCVHCQRKVPGVVAEKLKHQEQH